MDENETGIRDSENLPKIDSTCQRVKRQYLELHFEMDNVLASRTRVMLQVCVGIEAWAIKEDRKAMIQESCPTYFPEAHAIEFPFKFSNTQSKAFFKLHDFSFRTIGVNSRILSEKNKWLNEIEKLYFKARALQISEINHLEWGFTEPCCAFSYD